MDTVSYGYFTLDRFDPGGDIWLFSTGSGIAPYLCMLQQKRIWEDFKKIILISSFKDHSQFVYGNDLPIEADSLTDFQLKNYNKFSFIPIYTRKSVESSCIINGVEKKTIIAPNHFENMINTNNLNLLLKSSISPKNSKVMLSGNPDMIKKTRNYLKTIDLTSSRRNNLGQITVENYW